MSLKTFEHEIGEMNLSTLTLIDNVHQHILLPKTNLIQDKKNDTFSI